VSALRYELLFPSCTTTLFTRESQKGLHAKQESWGLGRLARLLLAGGWQLGWHPNSQCCCHTAIRCMSCQRHTNRGCQLKLLKLYIPHHNHAI
jgi:hypothetical protein